MGCIDLGGGCNCLWRLRALWWRIKETRGDARMLRESQIMRIHYITGLAALFVVAVHILMRLIMPYHTSLQYSNVIANYHNFPYVVLLEAILVLLAIHGFNGLRFLLI